MLESTYDELGNNAINIKLIDGRELYYIISSNQVKWEKEWLRRFTEVDESTGLSFLFLLIIAYPERVILIRKSAIKSIVFQTDFRGEEFEYIDNYNRLDEEDLTDEELFLDDAVFKMRNSDELLFFSDTGAAELPFIVEQLNDEHFVKEGFIELYDDDGDLNFIPIGNIEFMDLKRDLIYDEETWKLITKDDNLNLN